MEPTHRLLRAAGFGGATCLGLYLAGFPVSAFISLAFVIGVLFILNVWTYLAATVTAAAVIWGGLAAAHMAPGFSILSPFEKHTAVALDKLRTDTGNSTPQSTGPATMSSDESLEKKLGDLKEACDKGLLTKTECDASRNKIMTQFEK